MGKSNSKVTIIPKSSSGSGKPDYLALWWWPSREITRTTWSLTTAFILLSVFWFLSYFFIKPVGKVEYLSVAIVAICVITQIAKSRRRDTTRTGRT
jgi:hypothetical protein